MNQLNLLRKLGFTEYEARAYLSLAKLGPSSIKEIVQDSKLPRNKAYETLQKLEDKHKVLSLPLSPKKYKITDPQNFNEEIDNMKRSVAELIKIIEQPKIIEYKEFFWIIKGRKAIQEKFVNNNADVKKELLICSNLSKILPKNIRTMKNSVRNGVKVQILTSFNPKKSESYIAWKSTGAEIRVFNEKRFGQLQRISIFDNETATIVIGAPEVKNPEDYIMLLTESKVFSRMLKTYFVQLWHESKPLNSYLKK